MCSCVYVCSVYIRVFICSHIHTCLYTHVLGWVCIAHTHTCLYNHVFMCVSMFIRLRLSLGPMYTRSLVHTCSLKYTQAHCIHMLTVYVYVYTLVRTIAHVYERTHTLVRTITCTHTLVCNHLYTLWYVWHVHMTSCSDIHTPACAHWFIKSPVHMRICMSCIYI